MRKKCGESEEFQNKYIMRKAITSLTLSSKKNERKTVVEDFEESFGKNSCSVIDFRSQEFNSKLRARKTNHSRQLFLNGNDEIDNHNDTAFKNTVNLKNSCKRKMSDDKENSCKYNKVPIQLLIGTLL